MPLFVDLVKIEIEFLIVVYYFFERFGENFPTKNLYVRRKFERWEHFCRESVLWFKCILNQNCIIDLHFNDGGDVFWPAGVEIIEISQEGLVGFGIHREDLRHVDLQHRFSKNLKFFGKGLL